MLCFLKLKTCLVCLIDCEGVLGCSFLILIVCRSCCLYRNRAGFKNGKCAVAVVNACNVFAAYYLISNIVFALSACCGVLKRQSGFICYCSGILIFKSKVCLICLIDCEGVLGCSFLILIVCRSCCLYRNIAGFKNGKCACCAVYACNTVVTCYRISNIICALITACFVFKRQSGFICYCSGIRLFKSKVCLICHFDCKRAAYFFGIVIVLITCFDSLYCNRTGFFCGKFAIAVNCSNFCIICTKSNFTVAFSACCFDFVRRIRTVSYRFLVGFVKRKTCLICLIHGQYVGRRKCFVGISTFSYSQIRTDLDFAGLGYCNLT